MKRNAAEAAEEGTLPVPANPPAVRVPARVLPALLFIGVCYSTALAARPGGPAAGSLAPAASSVVAGNVGPDATSSNNQVKLVHDRSGALVTAVVAIVDNVPQIVLARSQDGGGHWTSLAQASSGAVASRLPALGVDAADGLHVVWTRYDDGVGKIYYRLWRRGQWTMPQERISPAHGYAGFPGLALDTAGRPHVVWYGIREGAVQGSSRHGSIYEIFYTGFDGRAWSRPQLISTGIPDAINPALAADRSGRLHAAWFQSDGRDYQVRYAVRDAAWSEPETVLATRADAFNPDLAVEPGGAVMLVWEHHEGQVSLIRATGRRGTGWADPTDLSDPAVPALHPSVDAGPRGTEYVAWDTADGQIFVRRFTDRWQPAVRVAGGRGNTFPSVAASESGAEIVWTQTIDGRSSVRYLRLQPAPARRATPAATSMGRVAVAVLLALLILVRLRAARARSKSA